MPLKDLRDISQDLGLGAQHQQVTFYTCPINENPSISPRRAVVSLAHCTVKSSANNVIICFSPPESDSACGRGFSQCPMPHPPQITFFF